MIVVSSVAVLGVGVALLLAGLHPVIMRVFVLRTQTESIVAVARPGAGVCEGPIQTPIPARLLTVYAVRDPRQHVDVDVRSVRDQVIASGAMPTGSDLVSLDREIPRGTPVRVCVQVRRGSVSLLGAGDGNIVPSDFHTTGVSKGNVFALLLQRRSSFLGALGVAFTRAAIFRPSWMGAWTFWALSGLLLCAVGFAVYAAWSAAGQDDLRSEDG